MAKEFILYNLADNVTDEEYLEYVRSEKGPFLDGLASVEKFELVRVAASAAGQSPYQYIGILNIMNLEDFRQRDAPSEEFQAFLKKWQTKVSDFHILMGEEVF